MKIFSFLLSGFIIMMLPMMMGCTKKIESPLSDQQQAAKILDEGSPWGGSGKVEVVSLPTGVDPSKVTNLQLTFDTNGNPDWIPTNFSASGADDLLSASGALWSWATPSGTSVITLDGATVSELTSLDVQVGELRLTFEVNAASGGRIAGFDGTYSVLLKSN